MAYIAKVPVTFGGRKFYKGDRIPEDLVMSPKRQEELGTITVIPEPEAPKKSGRKAKSGGTAGDA